jgi:D-alanyl-D-alanine carboxypeptidase/D-alanyl-D-alanine-endopeptidase (penicillin-binding protein 4)
MDDGEVGPLTALSVNDARVVPGSSQLASIAGAYSTTPSADPAGHAATVFAELLRARGITVDGETKAGPAPASGQQIAAVDSLTVAEIVAQMLRFSDNNTAELLLKEIGLKAKKDPSSAGGAAVVLETLKGWGLNTEGVVVADGSGLDQTNRVTCDLLVRLLERDGPLGPLAAGLAVPQQNGTLRDRYEDSPAIDNVRAKTGTLSGVTSLSGWVASDIGSHIAFSYLMNMPDRAVEQTDLERQELLTELLTTYPDLPPMDQLEPLPAVTAGA